MKDFTLPQVARTGWPAPLRGSLWIVIALFALTTGCSSFQMVATGHVGVVTRFNKVTGDLMSEGWNFKFPWERVHEMTVRQQQLHEQGNVPSSEMLVLGLQTTLLFHLQADKATTVFDKLGPNYVQATVEPNFISAMRESTAKHKAEELFSGPGPGRDCGGSIQADARGSDAVRRRGGAGAAARHRAAGDAEARD